MTPVLHARAFEDNYIWLIRGNSRDKVAIVDPGDEIPVLQLLQQQQLRPIAILCTHHHWDHSGGIAGLRAQYDIPVYGPAKESVKGLTQALVEGDRVSLPELGLEFEVLEIPGHTRGHIAFYGHNMLFCGDTLFSAGCGRLFEGTPEQMHASLNKLSHLPATTQVFCGHEYTLSNLQFAQAVEPDNGAIQEYFQLAREQRAQDLPTLPSSIDLEQRVNPFLRVMQDQVRRSATDHAHERLDTDIQVFAALRRWKDNFRR